MMKTVSHLLFLFLLLPISYTFGGSNVDSNDFTVPTFPTLSPLDELWQEILFSDNGSMPQVQIVDPFGTEIPSDGSMCIYVTDHDHPDIPDNNHTLNFHCARGKSQPCLHHGKCESKECKRPGGLCSCQPGFEGVNCGIPTELVYQPDCPLKCVHGMCVADGKHPYCACEPGYTGGLCNEDAYYHECTGDGFHICITPFSMATFSGAIYVTGHKGKPECSLEPVEYPPDPYDNIPDWCTGYVATIPFNSSCGNLGPTFDGEVTTFQLQLLLQYGKGVVTCTDERVTLTCQFNKANFFLYKTLELDIEGLRDIPLVTKAEDFIPVSMTLAAADGSSLLPPLPVGFKLDVCVYTMEALGFEGVIVNSVLINNTRQGDDYRQMFLYHQGCVSENLNSILSLEPYWTSNEKMKTCFQFKVFFFNNDLDLENPAIGLVIDISLVTDKAEALKPVCGTRTKRQAVAGKDTTLSTVIKVTISDSDVGVSKDPNPAESRPWLMPVLYSAGGIFLTLAIVLIVVTIKLRRRSSKKKAPLDEPRAPPIAKKFY